MVSWHSCGQYHFIFQKLLTKCEFLCVTLAGQLALALCTLQRLISGCYHCKFVSEGGRRMKSGSPFHLCAEYCASLVWWSLAGLSFLEKFIISYVAVEEGAKLGEMNKLLKCSQMQYRCKSELFAWQSFFILILRTECLIFISLNISIKSPFATSIHHLCFHSCII